MKPNNFFLFISLFIVNTSLQAQKTFLPTLTIEKDSRDNAGWLWTQATKEYNLFYKEENGHIKLLNAAGDTIFANIYFISEFVNEKNKHVEILTDHFNRELEMLTDDVANFQYSTHNDTIDNKIQLRIDKAGAIDLTIDATIKQNVKLVRHALCISYALPLNEVEKKNKSADKQNFKDEYWLDKEGFILSGNKTNVVVYRPDSISSIQLDTKNCRAVFNLDYALDHPMFRAPNGNRSLEKWKIILRKFIRMVINSIPQLVFLFLLKNRLFQNYYHHLMDI
jgi:hypothetical protein